MKDVGWYMTADFISKHPPPKSKNGQPLTLPYGIWHSPRELAFPNRAGKVVQEAGDCPSVTTTRD